MRGATIVNAHPLPGETASYVSHWNEPSHETFALIAFLPNLGGNGRLLLLQELDVAGTQAAAEALIHPDAIDPILRRATRPERIGSLLRDPVAFHQYRIQLGRHSGGGEQDLLKIGVYLAGVMP